MILWHQISSPPIIYQILFFFFFFLDFDIEALDGEDFEEETIEFFVREEIEVIQEKSKE